MIKEIIDFQEANLWKNINNGDTTKEITLIGKYVKSNGDGKIFLGYLADINMSMITLIKGKNINTAELEKESIYKVTGVIKKYPDNYSNKLKLYIQLEVNKIEKLEKSSYPSEITNILERKEKILARKKAELLDEIKKKLIAKEKMNFLYIVSEKYKINDEEKDILNDLYFGKREKNNLQTQFGLEFDSEDNIIRTKFTKDEFFSEEGTLNKIKEKMENNNFDGLVFVKGGGNNMKIFEDIDFCEEIVKLNIPFITAVGHTDDNELLLSQIANINYSTPTRLGVEFLKLSSKIYFANQKEKALTDEKIKLKDSEDKFKKLEKEKREIEDKLGSTKTKNVIFMFIIVILLGYSIFSTFFMKREVKEKIETTKIEEVNKEKNIKVEETKKKIEETKKEEKSNTTKNNLKENLNNLKDKIITTEKKDNNNNQKNIPTKKAENKSKKLVYSEDYLYTVLSWKGYRGERAIQEFQRDNGMKVTGKVDENLLKKLGIKIEYK